MKKRNKSSKKISIIVPAYKQEKTIKESLQNILKVLEESINLYEVIVVVDGITDKTFENAKSLKDSRLIVVGYEHNHGKGHALRFGMAKAEGDIIAFIDAGMDLNPNGLSMLVEHFQWYDADIVVGSKWHPISKVKYPLWRRVLSLGYWLMVRILFGMRVRDTQLGMKVFKREVLEKVLPRLLVKKYAIDVELLAVADRLGFKRIFEAPIELDWKNVDSNVSKNLLINIWCMFWDTLAIFYRLNIIKYYDDSSRRKWRIDPELNYRVNLP